MWARCERRCNHLRHTPQTDGESCEAFSGADDSEVPEVAGVAEALKQIERWCTDFVERHDLAVYDSIVREFGDAFRYARKPAGEIFLIARPDLNAAAGPDTDDAVSVELQLIAPLATLGRP